MKQVLFIILWAATSVAGQADLRSMKILHEDRIYPNNGVFSFEFETENGIVRSESGNEDLVRSGVISFPLPNGKLFTLKFVADHLGYKPESPYLPVPPVFPHPIPPHALRQIRRGELERKERERLSKNKKVA